MKIHVISKNLKGFAALVAVSAVACLALVGLSVSRADASTTGTVAATVTPQNISVTVTSGTVSYGTLATSTSKSTIATDLNDTQVATNNGNVAEDLNIEGQSSTDWTLTGSIGANQYTHKFCTATCTSPPTNFTALTTSYQALGTNITTSGTKNLDLQITTPSSSTSSAQQTVDVTVQAVIH